MVANLQQNLFGNNDFIFRKIPSQNEFEERNYPLLLGYKEMVYDSFEQLHRKIHSDFRPGEMDKNLPATYMVSCLRKRVIGQYPSYCSAATKSRFKLLTPSNEYIYLKKLNDDKRPSNIKTNANDLIINQIAEINDTNPNIFIGYTATEYIAEITGIYAVCIQSKRLLWVTDISMLDEGAGNASLVSISPTGGTPKLKEGIITLKQNIKKE